MDEYVLNVEVALQCDAHIGENGQTLMRAARATSRL